MWSYRLPAPVILLVQGKDAERYLNARLTNNIKTLAPGGGCLAAALNPQGRCEGLFAVYRLAAQEFLLVCDGGDPGAVVAALKRYMVADRVSVDDKSSFWAVLHVAGSGDEFRSIPNLAPSLAGLTGEFRHAPASAGETTLIFYARRIRSAEAGYDLIGAPESLELLVSSMNAPIISAQEYALKRARACIPSFPEELNEDSLFSESGLRHAVSFTKGCYVGQEVVERIDAIGKNPRLLRVLELHSVVEASPEDIVRTASGEKLGEVVSVMRDERENRTLCFASLKNSPASEVGASVRLRECDATVRAIRCGE